MDQFFNKDFLTEFQAFFTDLMHSLELIWLAIFGGKDETEVVTTTTEA